VGVTGVIDRSTTIRDRTVELGMEVEIIASKEQCGSELLFYGVGVLAPSCHTGIHVHDDVEIAWFMLEGDTYWVMGDPEDDDYAIEECHQNSAGYVAPGELHCLVNRSETERAVVLMAYVGVNTASAAKGRSIDPSRVLLDVLEGQGIALPDPGG
jgi:uncharacterized RmlC-like cupin family protein